MPTPQGIEALKLRKIDCVVLRSKHWKSGLAKYLDEPKRRSYWKAYSRIIEAKFGCACAKDLLVVARHIAGIVLSVHNNFML
jgi:hypothetical protein